MRKTPIQGLIEKNVTNSIGYTTPKKREDVNSEKELQYHLDCLNFMVNHMEKGYIFIGDDPEVKEFFRQYKAFLSHEKNHELFWDKKSLVLTDHRCDDTVDSYFKTRSKQ